MKILYGSTALALALGFGAAVASAPASAAGAPSGGIILAQGAGGTGGTGGTGTGSGGSEESGAVHPMDPSAAQPTATLQCDADGDGFVDTDEARACYQQHYGTISGGSSSLTEEQFSAHMSEMEDAPGTFAQIDADGDGEISEEEWVSWQDERFATDTSATEGRMSADDYGAWQMGGRAAR